MEKPLPSSSRRTRHSRKYFHVIANNLSPDYAASALTLTPMLLVSGKNGDQTAHLSNLNWRVLKQDGSAATQALTAGTGLAKKLAANLTDCTGLKITARLPTTDPVSRAQRKWLHR